MWGHGQKKRVATQQPVKLKLNCQHPLATSSTQRINLNKLVTRASISILLYHLNKKLEIGWNLFVPN